MSVRLQPGKYKNTVGPCCCPSETQSGTVDVSECCCDGVSIFAPCHCLCHAAVPCGTCCNEEGTQCYYAWVYCSGAHGMGVIASDGGKKFATDWFCMSCGEYVLEDAPTGAPPTIAMER
ncbi:hypothetical protein EMIHUDRAFT_202685 [Emiliania huxleyi CCMP1516]|uniref:Uncharacterized protein n=2 Tax=Emiliania huxleyi TaxID=2903 RepID=A0A0D3K8L5_EMIH1|nr:hypothetical protein EMIHUDRAFT_202685 [Emiliania huxleyi CCMP1516]EOD32100.1 hypothetical protein EMIHUDRAFT_202685 [Emiliania huxleyi CCMP1516]|eukprot:XP_005784529.1 hypothetical protein EMIHUDRAFT_202685 [Emiliania huxleyi CCMP1516]